MFPDLYNAHQGAYREDIPFWLSLASASPGPILELGCGSGRVLLQLARAGHHVVGLDNNREMLNYCARELTHDFSERVHLLRGDIRIFGFAAHFGLVIMPCNTISTFSRFDLASLLKSTTDCMVPGGVFAASLPNPLLLSRLPASTEPEVEDGFLHPDDGEPVQVSSAWERTESHFIVSWIYDHLLPDGEVQRTNIDVQYHLHTVATYLEELALAGFEQIKCFGSFKNLAYRKSSPYLILVANRGLSNS